MTIKNPTHIKRGAYITLIEATKNQPVGTIYQLVRVMANVPCHVDSITGKPSTIKHDVYNLVNVNTGQTRVSDPARMLRTTAGFDLISVERIRTHFNLDIQYVIDADTIKPAVSQAIAKAFFAQTPSREEIAIAALRRTASVPTVAVRPMGICGNCAPRYYC